MSKLSKAHLCQLLTIALAETADGKQIIVHTPGPVFDQDLEKMIPDLKSFAPDLIMYIKEAIELPKPDETSIAEWLVAVIASAKGLLSETPDEEDLTKERIAGVPKSTTVHFVDAIVSYVNKRGIETCDEFDVMSVEQVVSMFPELIPEPTVAAAQEATEAVAEAVSAAISDGKPATELAIDPVVLAQVAQIATDVDATAEQQAESIGAVVAQVTENLPDLAGREQLISQVVAGALTVIESNGNALTALNAQIAALQTSNAGVLQMMKAIQQFLQPSPVAELQA